MQRNKKCIIYTRVSSKEQLLENYSIEAQSKYCEEYAIKLGFTEIKFMGGIAESAKDKNRKTYKEMLNYVLDKRNGINAVLVYSIDRFSRHIATAAPDIEKLKMNDIILYSVQEGISSATDMGMFLINFKLSNSQFENSLRSSRAKAGVKMRILAGEYPFATPPIGYRKDAKKKLIVNEDGELIRKAFKMLLDGYTMTHVMKVMYNYGLMMKINRWGEIVRNPIYAGLIVSQSNDNIPVKGVHESLISEKHFNRLQLILSGKSKPRLKVTDTIELLPLKTMIKCPSCGGKLTGDIKKSKVNTPAYYKCNYCSFTASAKKANESFLSLLSGIEFNQVFINEFREILEFTFNEIFREKESLRNKLLKEINTKDTKLANLLDDKYSDKITETQFETLNERYNIGKENMQNQLLILDSEIPDKFNFIEDCLMDLSNITQLWTVVEYMDKQQVFASVFKDKPSVVNKNHKIGLSDINLNRAFRGNLVKLAFRKQLI